MSAEESLVVRHVGDIYRNANASKGQSWRILNGALTTALRNCITAHLPFEVNDFDAIYRAFNGGYWFGVDGDGKGYGISLYSIAVDVGNMSACVSFEAWRGFKPFLYLGRRLAVAGMPYESQAGELWWLTKPPTEVIIKVQASVTEGRVLREIECARFADRWWVTGLSKESIRLANYVTKKNPAGHRDGKPTRLMQLTHEELDMMSRNIRAAIKAAQPKLEKEAT